MTTPTPDINSLLDQLREQWLEVARERDELRVERRRLRESLQFVKQFFLKLENDGDENDPLTAARRRYHAPVLAKIDAALNDQKGPSE